MRIAVNILLCAGTVIAAVGSAHAQTSPAPEDAALLGGALPERPSEHGSVEACWSKWLAAEGLHEGKNDRNGHTIVVSQGKVAVGEEPGSRNWLVARDAKVSLAELNGRKQLAETIRLTIQSDRSAAIKMFGGDDAPPSMRPVAEQLSLADKSRVLADKAVDAEIKKYDPKWSGGANKTEKLATLQAKIDENISTSTAIFASGAFTVVQCEGPSAEDDGKYSVLLGMIWSPTLAKVAESIWNPAVVVTTSSPDMSLSDHFASLSKDNPDWMAYTSGARVFTNEKGERVVVGFGVAPKSSLMVADKDRARLSAYAAIQRFLGEKLVANSELHKQLEQRDYTDNSSASFDTSGYQQHISMVSKDFPLIGAAEVGSWRGEHPWSKAGMQVVAVAWSQSWAADSREIGKLMKAAEQGMTRQGAVPQATQAESSRPSNAPAATGAKSGARSSTRDF